MIKISVIVIGGIKKVYFKEGIDEYLKRLSIDAKISVEEIKSEPFFDNSNNEKIKNLEGKKILKYLEKHSHAKIMLLHEKGKELDSFEFSTFLSSNNKENIVFVIGGALGLSQEVLNYPGATKFSLSKLTFPHELARLVLFEQIYRALAIAKNKKYHY